MKIVAVCLLVCLGGVLTSALKFQNLDQLPSDEKWVSLSALQNKNLGDIWSDCSQSGDPFKILNVTITPDPPVKGQNISVKATVDFEEEVTKGTVAIKLKWSIITVINESLDLCTEAEQANIMCPIQEGSQSFSLSAPLPAAAPGGHYTGSLVLTDQNGKQLVCVNLDFHL